MVAETVVFYEERKFLCIIYTINNVNSVNRKTGELNIMLFAELVSFAETSGS